MGKASEVSIRTEKLVAVARPLTPDYFVVLALSPEGNVGRARYELRVAAELAHSCDVAGTLLSWQRGPERCRVSGRFPPFAVDPRALAKAGQGRAQRWRM